MIRAIRAQLRRLAEENESGQALVEFVIVFPVQLFLTLAILQFALIMNAHVVVQQAAFLGARAAAVSDTMTSVTPKQAADRIVARQLAVLTSGDKDVKGRTVPSNGKLEWEMKGKKRYGFTEGRAEEAYSMLEMPDIHDLRDKEGYLSCYVEYNYVLTIPVANSFFAMSTPRNRTASNKKKLKVFVVRRTGFVATPWTQAPQ